jgi:hypothetical protein
MVPAQVPVQLECPSGGLGWRASTGVFVDDFALGMPIIPATGQPEVPRGYYLSDGTMHWDITMSDEAGTMPFVTVFNPRAHVMSYMRDSETVEYDSTHVVYTDAGEYLMEVFNPNSAAVGHQLMFISIQPDSEMVTEIQGLTLQPNTSIRYAEVANHYFRLENSGAATSYGIRSRVASPSGDTSFFHHNISLPAGTGHAIASDWRHTNDSLRVLIDSGLDGIYDDTLYLANDGPCDCPYQGDFDEDGYITALDLGALIDVLFAGVPDVQDPNCPTSRGDIDCDGFTTALDLAGMIDHLVVSGPGPCDPCE